MSPAAILAPVFIQVALTIGLLILMGRSRFAAIRRGEVRPDQVALGQAAWPAKPTQFANCYNNQFQLPVLFYVAVVVAMVTAGAGFLFVIAAWVFALSRLWHAYVHTTSNALISRFRAFMVGLFALGAMWLLLVFHVLFA
jgi:hypothetical protein